MSDQERLLTAIKDLRFARSEIAERYAEVMCSKESLDWKLINKAITDRWSSSGLQHIKRLAWKIVDGSL